MYTGLSTKAKPPLDYQCTLFKNEGQEGKINLFQEWVAVEGVWAQEKGE
jgi:hypothetical protein